ALPWAAGSRAGVAPAWTCPRLAGRPSGHWGQLVPRSVARPQSVRLSRWCGRLIQFLLGSIGSVIVSHLIPAKGPIFGGPNISPDRQSSPPIDIKYRDDVSMENLMTTQFDRRRYREALATLIAEGGFPLHVTASVPSDSQRVLEGHLRNWLARVDRRAL